MSIVSRGGAPPLAPFDPRVLGSCYFWLDGSDASSITTSGGNVTAVRDKSGSGFSSSSIVGTLTYSSRGLNFDGSQLINFTDIATHTLSAQTAFIVCQFNVATGQQYVIGVNRSSGTAGIQYGITVTGSFGGRTYGNTSILAFPHSPVTGLPLLYDYVYITGGGAGQWNNGTQFGSNGTASAITGSGSLTLGGYADTANVPQLNGVLYEVIIYNRVLTASERQQVEGYLAAKWRPSVSIPRAPPAISNTLALWIDSADATTVTLSGSNVTSVTSKGSGAHVFSNATGFTYTNNTWSPAGMPSFFNASGMSSQHLGSNVSISLSNPLTVFFVGSLSAQTLNCIFDGTVNVAEQRILIFGPQYQSWSGGSSISNSTSFSNNTTILYNGIFNAASSSIFINGNQVATGTTGSFTTSSGLVLATRLSIDHSWSGHWCELLMYNGTLSTSDRQSVEAYLAYKWGLQSNLPTTHPSFPRLQLPFSHLAGFQTLATRPFLPIDLPGLAGWYDAADSSSLTLSGTRITQWNDKSGNGRHLSNNSGAASNCPQITTAYANGVQMALFQGTATGTTTSNILSNSSYSLSNGNMSLYFVARGLSDTSNFFPGLISLVNTSASTEIFVVAVGHTGYSSLSFYDSYGGGLTTITNSFPFPLGLYGYNTSNNTLTSLCNSVLGGSATVTASNINLLGLGMRWLGGTFANAGNGTAFDGVIGEVLLYSNSHTAAERNMIEGYLARKWELITLYPTTHPFRTNPIPPSLGLFSPTSIANCFLWLDGGDASSFDLNTAGTGIRVWRDKSGNNRHGVGFTVGGGLPVAESGGGITFNGSNYLLNRNSAFNLSTRSIFIVFRVSAYDVNDGVFNFIPNPVSGNDWNTSNGLSFTLLGAGFRVLANPAAGAYDVTLGSSNALTSHQLYNDNMSVTAGSSFYNGSNISNVTCPFTVGTATGYIIGSRWDSGAPFTALGLTGTVNEILCYNGPLNTTQRRQVEGYLAAKWGLQGLLPANHPNKRVLSATS